MFSIYNILELDRNLSPKLQRDKNGRKLVTTRAIPLIEEEGGRRKWENSNFSFSISFRAEFRRIYYVNDTTLPNLGP